MHVHATTRNAMGRRPVRFDAGKRRSVLGGLGDGTGVTPATIGVPRGTQFTYVGTWRTTWTLRSDEVRDAVGELLALAALPVRSSSIEKSSIFTDVLWTPQNFNVKLVIQSLGDWGKIDDVISVIRHDVQQVTGLFPLADSVSSIGGASTGLPGSPDNSETWSDWLQSNAGIIGVGLAAVLLGTVVVKKL